MRAEKKLAEGMLRTQGQAGSFPQLAAVYDRAAEVLDLPAGQFSKAFEELQQQAKASSPIAAIILPSMARARETDAQVSTLRVMLRAAIAVQMKGPGQLELPALKDPSNGQPFSYRKTGPNSFELGSQLLTKEGKPLTLPVGTASQP